jgi:ribosome-associated translation inhibitor RaiA
MAETKGKILLSGFELDAAERAICDNVIKSHVSKITERADFDYIKIRLRKSQRGKNYLHEIEGTLKVRNQVFTAKTQDFNLFSALAEVMEKLLNELVHKLRTNRQRK